MAFIESGKTFDKEEHHEKLSKRIEDTTQYSLRIPSSLYKKLRIKLAKEDKKLRPVLIELLQEYMKK